MRSLVLVFLELWKGLRVTTSPDEKILRFHGGAAGAVAPLVLFLAGVAWLALSGAPSERGFWPVLLAALTLGLLLARDRRAYSETLLAGMSRPIVMLMVMAWLLAGVLATLMQRSGLVESLVWLAGAAGVGGRGFVAAAFLVCCAVSTATGTSLGTVVLCAPLLYPAGGALGASPVILIGAILGGATFGDNVSPVSDTTIASAATQRADLGGVVLSRLRYALPAAAAALVAYVALGAGRGPGPAGGSQAAAGSPDGLPMILAPALTVVLLLRRRHLIEGLLFGILAAAALGLGLGLVEASELVHVDAESYGAGGLVVDGIERGLGVSVFTLLLMGLVASVEAAGLVERLVGAAERRTRTARGAEFSIFAATSAAVVLTTHSTVAILAVGELARRTGERFGIGPYRRANLLDVTVCTYPFLLPYCIPTILAASFTASGQDLGVPRVSAFAVGMANFHSWALLASVLVAVATGWGRTGRESRP